MTTSEGMTTSAPASPVVLITGATGPTGRAAAARFAADGARLALNGSDPDRLGALIASLSLDPAAAVAAPGDLTDAAAARAVVDAVLAQFGRVDVLLHLVGGWTGGTGVVDLDPVEVRWMLDQHLWTTLHVLQAVVPGMVERGFGRVIAVSSPFASTPGPRGASYAMAKSAEEVLVRTLAREHAGDGITANLLVVKTVDAGHEREAAPSKANSSWVTPEEVADTLAWLASPAAAAVNGARIPLDGR
jgi:NAD(P)-dependent dehydrogenase (short-subunit alcohol dehydrogenase family)